MTADERVAAIRVKVERANHHINDLESELQLFLDSDPYVVGAKCDLETRQVIYYLAIVTPVPPVIATITGDVIQNLRSALDHLAYHLVVVGSGDTGNFRHVYFPIADSADHYKASRDGKVRGMRQEAIDAIDALRPYGDGNDALVLLNQLSVVDKHRLLLTVGMSFRAMNIGPFMESLMRKLWTDSGFEDADEMPTLDVFVRPDDRMFPIKAGDELFTAPAETDAGEKMEFAFDIAFGESEVGEGRPLVPTLHQLSQLVDGIVVGFRSLLE